MASLSEKIGYALGDAAAGGITWKIMSIAFPIFFTNVFGLSLGHTAALVFISKCFDVVTDPLMGSLADRTQSRWGTYRPWLIFGAIPFGLIFALLLFTPDFGETGKLVWAYSLYIMMMAVYTAVNVPYGSLLGVMTADDNEKNQFSSYRMVGAYAMGFITLLSLDPLLNYFGGEQYVALNEQLKVLKENASSTDAIFSVEQQIRPLEQHAYAMIGLGFGLLAAIMTLACGFMVKERLQPARAEKFSFKQFVDLVKNKPWIYLTSMGICTNFFNGFRYAVVAYMFLYCLNGNVPIDIFSLDFIIASGTLMAIGEVTCMIFGGISPKFAEWIGSKRMAFVWSSVICFVTSLLFFIIPMDSSYIWPMIVVVILTSIGVGLYSPLLWSMYADVADYAVEKNGTASTGLIFSSGTMAQKLGGAVSGALITLFLGWAGATMVKDAFGNESIDPASINDSVRIMIWALFSLFPAGIAIIMAFLAYKFPIKK